jgi:hypothetical protein
MVSSDTLPRAHLTRERLLSFSEAVKSLPTVSGRRLAPSTLYRWARRGIGGTRLEYLRIGRCMVTSREALERFFTNLAMADDQAATVSEGHNRD